MKKPILIAVIIVIILVIVGIVLAATSGDATVTVAGTPAAAAVAAGASAGPSLPAGIAEGDVIRCTATGGIYKIVNGKKQWYPSPAVWGKYGNPGFKDVDCGAVNSIPDGPNFERMSTAAQIFK